MIKVNAGQTAKVQIKRLGTITLVNSPSSVASLTVNGEVIATSHTGTQTYGPFLAGGKAVITAITGSVDYSRSTKRNSVKPAMVKDGALIDSQGLLINVGDVVGGGPVIKPTAPTGRAIREALFAALAVRGRVVLDSLTTYDLTDGGTNNQPLPIYNNMSISCDVMPSFQWSTIGFQSPDSIPQVVVGAQLVGDGTFDAFEVNSGAVAPFPNPGSFSNAGISGAHFENLVFKNVRTAIHAGGQNNPGLWHSDIRRVYVIESTGWGIDLENFQHICVSQVYTLGCKNGQRYACSSGNTILSPGNSEFDHLFNNRKADSTGRGILLEAYGTGAELNECNIDYIQCNSGPGLVAPVPATMSSASANISVPNASLFVLDQPVYFTVLNTNGFNTPKLGRAYFVVNVNTTNNTIQVANMVRGTAIVPTNGTANSTQSVGSFGFPGIEIVGHTGGKVLHWTMANIDQEAVGTMGFLLQNALSGKCSFRNVVSPAPGKAQSTVASRESSFILESCYEGIVIDADAASSVAWLGARTGVPIQDNYGFGITRSDTTGLVGLALTEYQQHDAIVQRPSNFGGDTVFWRTALQHRVTQRGNGETEAVGNGTYFTLNSSGGNRNLPLINNDNQLGVTFSLTNPYNATATYTANAANTFNNKAGAAVLTIPAHTSVTVQAQKLGSTFFWAVLNGNGATF